MQWQIAVEGEPCRFLILAHPILGEHDFASTGLVQIDNERKRFSFRPNASSLWGSVYPEAVYHIVTSTPEAVDVLGGDELLFEDGRFRQSPVAVLRTKPLKAFRFAAVGSMRDPHGAERLAQKYVAPIEEKEMLRSAAAFWTKTIGNRNRHVTQDLDTFFPWLVHNAVIHLSVPHGLEQYSGGAWGTRDVCQGPVELLLALGHYGVTKELLRRILAKQIPASGDWPQWFMLEPYGSIEELSSQGDVLIWPLKALCDYVETANDIAFLSEPIAWRGNSTGRPSGNSVTDHVDALLNAIASKFLSGTHLPRFGGGDWNDTLQPANPMLKERMVSSWTAALLFQQLRRYSLILRKAGQESRAGFLKSLAENISADFNHYLIRDGVVAGYAVFGADSDRPGLLLHPSDRETGVSYSLLPMICAIAGGLFSPEQTRHHLSLICEHLLFPDGVRLMDKPIGYHGGAERIFRRAESAAFFGREVGLMYVHAHLRYCEALRIAGQEGAFQAAIQLANPISVTELARNAGLRQRNCYFSSSDPAFNDRYEAAEAWKRVSQGTIRLDAGWRIYSSGPGLFVKLLSGSHP
jgi:1,2-beta-oligoglucan phosphorylase